MSSYPKLTFPPIDPSTLRRTREGWEVVDRVRRCRLKLTPEEWVRRHVIGWLIGLKVNPMQIIQEYPVLLNGQAQRADIVVVNASGQPELLVECKAGDVPLTREVLDQACCYNQVVHSPRILLTNGLQHRCLIHNNGHYHPIEMERMQSEISHCFSDH
uniref:type I restriction enzyme HsdR N-terminal domain-containing protein n=1 Tax=Alistipes sp. TaxID=1872444 RepID=UPI004056C524